VRRELIPLPIIGCALQLCLDFDISPKSLYLKLKERGRLLCIERRIKTNRRSMREWYANSESGLLAYSTR
jgi:hypothetical protein